MVNCPNCNAGLPDQAQFCIYCGTKLAGLTPGAAAGAPEDSTDKIGLLKSRMAAFKAKMDSNGGQAQPEAVQPQPEGGQAPSGDEKAGVYSTNGYSEQYTIDRGSYNKPARTAVSAEDLSMANIMKQVTGGGSKAKPQQQPQPQPEPQPQPQSQVQPQPQPQSQPSAQETPANAVIPLKPGHCYLIEENKPNFCFVLFAHYTKEDFKGLCISRVNPKRIRGDYEMPEDAKILWLTDSTAASDDVIPPSLERITYDIKGFIAESKDGKTPLIVFDGLEYLLSNNQFNPVIRFLRRLVDECSMSDSVMLIPLSPLAISQQELKMLEREFDVVERD